MLLVLWVLPHRLCARGATAFWEGRCERLGGLARTVERWTTLGLSEKDFTTGHELFNGEWLFGTYQMAALGFGQTALEHPQWRRRHAAFMRRCISRMLSQEVRAFDRERWREDPLEALEAGGDHAAYLGYLNLVLGLHRLIEPDSPYAGQHDRITAAIVRRLERSPFTLLQTYPGEAYPVDMAAGIGSLGLHALATGTDHRALIERWAKRCRSTWIDPATGLLFQTVDPATGAPRGQARGSGTSLAVYFLSFADNALSGELFAAMRRTMAGNLLGFGMAREYPPGGPAGSGDIDSGPVPFGYGVSATGFLLAASRIHGDRELYERLYATVDLFGAPLEVENRLEFATGGPLGNAMMFALLTAQPANRWARRGAP